MSFTIVTNDARAAKITGTQRHEMQEVQGTSSRELKVYFDEVGLVALIGRGETDATLTYVALQKTGGTLTYIHPNAAGDGIVVTTVKP